MSSDARGHSAGRTLAALIGTLPVALAVALAIAYLLPVPITERYLIGSVTVLPLWTAASCWTFLAPSGRRAWRWLAIALAAAVLVIVVVRMLAPPLTGGLP